MANEDMDDHSLTNGLQTSKVSNDQPVELFQGSLALYKIYMYSRPRRK